MIQEGSSIKISFNLITSIDGADKATVYMMDAENNIIQDTLVGKSDVEAKEAVFTPKTSGEYFIQVEGARNGEETTKLSTIDKIDYVLPLGQPVARAFNQVDGSLLIKWFSVLEAESYMVEYK